MLSTLTPEPSAPPNTPPSPSLPSPTRKMPLSVSNVTNILVRMRRSSGETKSHHINSCSGEPQTHPSLLEDGITESKKIPISYYDIFICEGAVDVPRLLRATRTALLEIAESAGANVLVNEQWKCTICGPKNRSNGTFKVQLCYSASATRAQRPDPGIPVALQQAKCVPGLMTILRREEHDP